MWPTDDSFNLLLCGLLPLLFVGYTVLKYGFSEATSLGCLGILFTWLGFHLSPWIFYCTGEWANGVLCEGYIDDGLRFTTAMMLVFLVGYEYTMWTRKGYASAFDSRTLHLPEIRVWWLVALLAVLYVLFVLRIEGVARIWRSDVTREQMGQGSWVVHVSASSVSIIAGIALRVVTAVLTLMASLYVLQEGSWGRIKPSLISLFFLVASSLPSIWAFSRTAGQSFLLLGLLSLKVKGMRALPLAIVCCLLIVWLGNVGLMYRKIYYPGVANFAEAAMGYRKDEVRRERESILAAHMNPLDFMHSWTRKASLVQSGRATWNDGFNVLWNLHPVPSTLLPSREIGPSLSEVMNTFGNNGLTTPALGEVYYAMGYWSLLLGCSVGALCAWCECRIRKAPTTVNFICFLLFMLSFPVGLHQGVRAMSRPVWYALMLLLFCRISRPNRQVAPSFHAAFAGQKAKVMTTRDYRNRIQITIDGHRHGLDANICEDSNAHLKPRLRNKN